jgi:2-amino-4-hydroxy-6-hydroxymethyldihydropteridine diphosphokinase
MAKTSKSGKTAGEKAAKKKAAPKARAVTRYLIALGGNRYRKGPPQRMIGRAIKALKKAGVEVNARSPVIATDPLGPGTRRYANAAIRAKSDLSPPELLTLCKTVEHKLGRRSGRRWGDRVIDLDLILWSGGCWSGEALTLPHPEFRRRSFVLDPLAAIAPRWRDPVTGLTVRHLRHRLRRNIPVDRRGNHP